MISGWVLVLALFFTVLQGILIVIGMRIMTQNDIIIRAIPFGSPKIQERAPRPTPASQPEMRETRPVGATATGRHG